MGILVGLWYSLGTSVFSANKTDHHDITEILLKVVVNIIAISLNSELKTKYSTINVMFSSLIGAKHLEFEFEFEIWCLMPLSIIFQLYHGDEFFFGGGAEYPERTTDPWKATGKLFHLRLRADCTFFGNLQSYARFHAVLVIGLYELLDPTT